MFDNARTAADRPSITAQADLLRQLLATALRIPAAAQAAGHVLRKEKEAVAAVEAGIRAAVAQDAAPTEDMIDAELGALHDQRDATLKRIARAESELAVMTSTGKVDWIRPAEETLQARKAELVPLDETIRDLIADRISLGKRISATDPANLAELGKLREEIRERIATARRERAAAIEEYAPKFLATISPACVVAVDGLLAGLTDLETVAHQLVSAASFARDNGLPLPRLLAQAHEIAGSIRAIRLMAGDR